MERPILTHTTDKESKIISFGKGYKVLPPDQKGTYEKVYQGRKMHNRGTIQREKSRRAWNVKEKKKKKK